MWRVIGTLLMAVPAVFCVCTQYPAVKDLKLKDMSGMWYGQYTLKRGPPEDIKCQRLHFYVQDDGKSVELTESILPKRGSTTKGTSFYTVGKQNGAEGKMALSGKMDGTTYNFEYSILGTDYKDFMISSMCILQVQSAWIMTRKPDPLNSDQLKRIKDALKSTPLTLEKFASTPQEKCA